ncbi:transporter [Ganoderma sinense ZZ0214-1]|uniref:Transporter n=1 Tax=Ganoderma sinense ZZ0214-1 TaxID=1077348 RepID=A0A2G8S227_9APHY|nr:transporter [Ganoderma sinense ZZ0214-1]
MPLVWLTHPVLWHADRTASWNFTAMTAEEIWLVQAKWHSFYSADWDYGQTTVYLFCAGIFLFGVANLFFQLRQRTSGDGIRKVPLYNKVVAASRSIGAKQFYVPMFDYYSPPLTAILVVAGMIVFFCALTFAARPYIWPNPEMGYSWPIATRSGWISIGMMPFLFVLGTKVNFISMVTGVSHEKLQVYHRWTAWIMYVTSLVHTFPFIVKAIHEHNMVYYWDTMVYYWTGVAALVPQTWMVFMSWGPIRNRYYETFKKLHFMYETPSLLRCMFDPNSENSASGIFVSALFIHCDFELTSWDYFWVTAALYGASWFSRVGRTFYNGLGSSATFEMLPENMVKVIIPTKVAWKPGQHFFIRFLNLGIHAASSHPFTIASLPDVLVDSKEGATTTTSPSKSGGERVMEVYARVHGGITARLAAVAQNGGALKTSRVLLDGPYGGFEGNLRAYDRVLLLGGGSGVSFVVPLLLDLIRSFDADQSRCRKVSLVWAVRTNGALSWFDDVISRAIKARPEQLSIDVSYYVTSDPTATVDDGASVQSGKSKPEGAGVSRSSGRPHLPTIVKDFCTDHGTVAIATCGPDSFNMDIGNAVAECELGILRGTSACSEIYLHRETYSW